MLAGGTVHPNATEHRGGDFADLSFALHTAVGCEHRKAAHEDGNPDWNLFAFFRRASTGDAQFKCLFARYVCGRRAHTERVAARSFAWHRERVLSRSSVQAESDDSECECAHLSEVQRIRVL